MSLPCWSLIHWSLEIANRRIFSMLMRSGAEIRTLPSGGYTLRWTFLMSFLTTSTVTDPSLRVVSINSIFLLLLDDEEDALDFFLIMEFLKDRLLNRLLACWNATP